MTKKDYQLVADVLRETTIRESDCVSVKHRDCIAGYAHAFADRFAAENPRFDRAIFLRACGVDA